MESNSDDEFFDCQNEPVKYYAVACQKDKGKGIVTTDMNEARTKLKTCRGSRFCSFYDPLEAKKFAEKHLSDDQDLACKKKSASQKKISDPFPNASPRDLISLKSAIESGAFEKVKELVWNNPRHLVTESDSPTLLQVRFRHNALHVAVMFNQAQIVNFILERLSEIVFWMSIYPTADENCNRYRMQRVLDMYLNAPEVGNLETPCHLASKFGHKQCLRLLLMQELTDVNLKNKSGFKPEEIICQRSPDIGNASKIDEIRQIFSEKFVVLLDGGGGKVLEPMTHCQLLRLLRRKNDGYQFDSLERSPDISGIIDNHGCVRAYIGPLEDIKARQLCYRWSILNAQDANKFEEIRRSDAEKGMEAHGRFLAIEFGAPWRELWHFLDTYLDLGCDDGLQQFESHLAKLDATNGALCDDSIVMEMESISTIGQSELQGKEISSQQSTSGILNSLVRLFSRMTLRSRGEEEFSQIGYVVNGNQFSSDSRNQSPIANRFLCNQSNIGTPMYKNKIIPSNVITSTPLRPQKSLRLCRTPFNSSVLGEGILTPTDRQVRRAVLSGRGKPSRFPRVSNWLDSLSQIDSDCSLPIHMQPSASFNEVPLQMSTPIKTIYHSSYFKRPLDPDSQKCLSPLSRIELPD